MKQESKPGSGIRRRLGSAALVAAALWLAPVQAQEPPLGSSLEGLLAYAREHNPELRGRRLEADAARERIEPAAALPDPRFQLELMDFTNAMNGGSTSLLPGQVGETRYRVIQPLPFWGKRGLRGEVAQALAGQSATEADSTLLDLEARIKVGFARYYQAAGETRILEETLALVDALGRLVETRYSVGLVPQQDAVRAQSEITGLKVELVEAARRRRTAAAPSPWPRRPSPRPSPPAIGPAPARAMSWAPPRPPPTLPPQPGAASRPAGSSTTATPWACRTPPPRRRRTPWGWTTSRCTRATRRMTKGWSR